MKRRSISVLAVLAALLLTACTPAASLPTNGTTPPTVADIFNETTASTESTDPVDATDTSAEEELPPGSMSVGPADGTWALDENGPYMIYPGEEMVLPFQIKATGRIAKNGVGILLFIDGQPQPYKTDDEPEYAYMHIFYPEDGENSIYDFRFTPVVGEEGDDLEIYAAAIVYPTYSLSDGNAGMVYTSGSTASGFRLKYEQTPPLDTYPEKQAWLSDVTLSLQDATSRDFAGWSDVEMRERIEHNFSINGIDGKGSRQIFDVSTDKPLSLRYELWGTHYVHYGLVFFVDNEPVFAVEADPILPQIQNGQKFVLEANLNLPEFDGESVVYAILVPRNYRSSEVMTTAFLQYGHTFFLLEGSAE